MTFDYFTPGDAEQYAYYSIPKMLIKGEQFRGISMEAKLLYGILLDRVSLSLKHGWVDENNHVYIIFTIEQIMEEMNCGNKKAVTLLNELEKKIHLVEKKRQGLGKPNLIYVKNFYQSVDQIYSSQENDENPELSTTSEEEIPEVSKRHSQKCQNDTELILIISILILAILILSYLIRTMDPMRCEHPSMRSIMLIFVMPSVSTI